MSLLFSVGLLMAFTMIVEEAISKIAIYDFYLLLSGVIISLPDYLRAQ